MSVSAVTNSTAVNAKTDSSINPKGALNQQDFLKLLVAQIQFQDPLNPQSDTQMAAQLAQFTSLQQSAQTSSSLAMLQANSLIGSTVTVQIDSKTTATGAVTGVVLNNGTPQITVGGVNYSLSQVTAITPATASTTSPNTQTSQ
jgi:flagellar basal-body rod modification protein FlgD